MNKSSELTLRFHKLNQVLLWPLSLLWIFWFLMSVLFGLLGVTKGILLPITSLLSPQQFPSLYILLLFYNSLQFLLIAFGLKDSFKWYSSSYHKIQWHYFINLVFMILLFSYFYMNNAHHAFALNLHIYFNTTLSGIAILLILIFTTILTVFYDLLAFIYYYQRRSKFSNLKHPPLNNSIPDFETKVNEPQPQIEKEEPVIEEETSHPITRSFYKLSKWQSIEDTTPLKTSTSIEFSEECPVCHHIIKHKDALYCPNCGHKLK